MYSKLGGVGRGAMGSGQSKLWGVGERETKKDFTFSNYIS